MLFVKHLEVIFIIGRYNKRVIIIITIIMKALGRLPLDTFQWSEMKIFHHLSKLKHNYTGIGAASCLWFLIE